MLKHKFGKSIMTIFLCLILVGVMAFGGCGKSDISEMKDESLIDIGDMSGVEEGYDQSLDSGGFGSGESPAMEGDLNTRGELLPTASFSGKNVKLIYTAYMNLQTIDFEKAEQQFIEIVKANEGYFESSYVDRGSYYSEGSHIYGSYTVRIPQKNYEAFLASVGETSHVVSINKNVTDIGMEYFDTETRLNTLRAKFDRLTALFNEATQMSDIITLESALADTQYEIDMYTSTLNRYDSLVDYSTVNVSIEQVERLGSAIDEDEGFFASLVRNIVNGFNHFIDSIESLFMWAAYNIISIAIGIGLLLLARKWYTKRFANGSPFSGERIKRIAGKIRRAEKKNTPKDKEE